MELLSPAGNVKKLYCAYAYGADAAYIGLKHFSLRVKADNFYDDEYEQVCELKKRFPEKKLYCALNIAFHNDDIASFQNNQVLFYAKEKDTGQCPLFRFSLGQETATRYARFSFLPGECTGRDAQSGRLCPYFRCHWRNAKITSVFPFLFIR